MSGEPWAGNSACMRPRAAGGSHKRRNERTVTRSNSSVGGRGSSRPRDEDGWSRAVFHEAHAPWLHCCCQPQNCDASAAVPVKSGVSALTSFGFVGSIWNTIESRVGTRWFGDDPYVTAGYSPPRSTFFNEMKALYRPLRVIALFAIACFRMAYVIFDSA